ncbi:MAG: hypothetical protein K8F30_05390 [Taibaiella sp.]|nr:hypothetical protein [Taibaiella sp.]
MNRILLAVTALAFTFTACEKKKSSILPPPEVDTVYIDTNKPVDTSLTIAGISDVRTTPWSEVTLPITVMRNNGLEQKVTMSISGLPEGVKAKFSSVTGYTTFNTNLMLEVGFLEPGTHELKIMSVSETGKSREYTIQLVVDSMTKREANVLFLSRIQAATLQTVDSTDSVIYMQTYILNNTIENQIYLGNVVLQFSNNLSDHYRSYMPGSNYHVQLSVDVNKGTIEIPLQLIQGRSWIGGVITDFTITGSGMIDIDNGQYTITYTTIHDNGGTLVTNEYTMIGALD